MSKFNYVIFNVLVKPNASGPRPFNKDDVELLTRFTDLVAITLQNAELFEQAKRRAHALSSLHIVSQSLLSIHDLQELLGIIAQNAFDVLGADLVTLHEYLKEQGDIRVPPIFRGDLKAPKILLEEGVAHQDSLVFKVMRRDSPFYATNAREDWTKAGLFANSQVQVDNSFIYREGIISSAGIPLRINNETLGVLFINYRSWCEFTLEECERIEIFANQAALAIHNTRLLQRERTLREQGDTLREVINKIAETISTKLSIEDLLEEVTYQITKTFNCTHCTIFLPQKEADQLWLVPQITQDSAEYKVTRWFKLGEGLAGWVFEQGQSLVLSDASADPRFAPATQLKPGHPRSLLVAPLKVGDRTVGVISADQDKNDWFSESDQFLLDALAQQIGTALQRANALELLQDISNRITSAQAVDEILELIVSGAIKMTNATSGGIYLISEDGQSVVKIFRYPSDIYHPAPRLNQGVGITHHVVTTGQTVIIPDTQKSALINPFFIGRMRSTIAIPLKLEQKVVGVLDLNDKDPHDFTEAEISILSTLANQAAIAIQKAQLFDDAQHRIRDLEIVNGIAQIISAKLHTGRLLHEIAFQITDKLNCNHCTLFFPEMKDNELFLVPQVTQGQLSEQIMRRRFRSDEGLVGWVFQHGQSEVLADVKQDPRFAPATVELGLPRSMLVAPIQVGEQTIGVISAEQDEFNWFSDSDRRLVDALARHAGIAIERAMGLELLQHIGIRIISNQTVDDTLEQIVSGAIALTNTAAGVIHLISGDDKSVLKSFQFPPNFDYPKPRLDEEEGLTLLVIKTGETQTIPDIHQDPRAHPALRNNYQSLIAVPLEFEQKVIGVLQLYDSKPHNFTETEKSLLSTLTSQAGIAIQNARLFEQIEEQREAQIKAVRDITRSIAAPNTLQEVLDGILGWTVSLMGKEYKGFVRLLNQERDELVTAAVSPGSAPTKQSTQIKVGQGVSGVAAEDKEIILIRDVEKEKQGLPGFEGTKSELAIPMLKSAELIGVLNIEHPEVDAFSESDIELAEAIAGLAVVAIENARLFERTQKQQEAQVKAVREIAWSIAAPKELQEVLNGILNWTVSLMGEANLAHVRLLDQETNELVLVAFQGEAIREEYRRVWVGKGITGWVAQHKKSQLVPDVQEDDRYIPALATTRSEIVVPMLKEGELIGVLNIEHPEVNAFSESDIELAEAIAGLAVVALENARLFERTQKQQEAQVKAVREITRSIAAPKALEEVLTGILNWTVSLMGEANLVEVSLLDRETNELVVKTFQGRTIKKQYERIPVGEGVTGWVAQYKKPKLILDVQKYERYLPALEDTQSEIAVPMLKEGEQLIGVLNIEHSEVNAFDESDVELAEAIAGLAVVALENAQLYAEMEKRVEERTKAWQEAQEKAAAAEKLAVMGQVGAEFVHRMNNLAGTIPVRINIAKENLETANSRDAKVIQQLDKIVSDTIELLQLAQTIKRAGTDAPQNVSINELVEIAIERVWSSKVNIEGRVKVEKKLFDALPIVYAERDRLLDTLINVIRNGIEAIPQKGTLIISTRKAAIKGQPSIEIAISDTGRGIATNDLPKIFSLFSTTKKEGLGFGLWWSKNFIKGLGGDIEVRSQEGQGSTFTIKIPVHPADV